MNNEKKNIIFFSQNRAPFRVAWLEELSNYFNVLMVHLGEYDKNLSKSYIDDINYNKLTIIEDYKIIFNKFKFFDYSILKKYKADIIIVDGYGYMGGLFLIFYLFIHKLKFVMSVDGGFVPSKENYIKSLGYVKEKDSLLISFIKKFVFSATNHFFSTSEETDKLIKYYSKNKPICFKHKFSNIHKDEVLSFSDSKILYEKYRKELNFINCKHYVLFTGKFIDRKNIELIFELFKYLNENYIFVLIGGKLNDKMTNFIKGCDLERFIIIDFMLFEDLKKYYYATDVFVMPTFHDVWGLVVTEAFAYGGLPVVSSDMCLAAKDLIENGENGYIIDYNKPGLYSDSVLMKRYADKIELICDNKELNKNMRINNLNKIKNYTIENSSYNDMINLKSIM